MVRIADLDLHMLDDHEEVCKDCANFKEFGERCWYFWKDKKKCSQKLK